MSELPWVECPTYEIEYETPEKDRYSNAPDEILDLGRNLLGAVMNDIPDGMRYLADGARARTANRFHDEIASLAKLIDADWRDLMLANLSYDLTLGSFGCSTVALATPKGPIVARNMDWWPEQVLARSSCLMRHVNSHSELVFANAGWPGAVGIVTGLSGRGFAIVLNAVVAPDEGPNIAGYPVLLYLRCVLEDASSFDEALGMLEEQTLASSALITLVGAENSQRVVIERSPTKSALRWPVSDDAALVTTNDYRVLYQPEANDSSEIYQTTCRRFDYLQQFYANHKSSNDVGDSQLLYALTDPQVQQAITAQHIIMRPRQRDARMFAPRHLL